MKKIYPDNIFYEQITQDDIYYETRNFINNILPFSLHTDIMVNTVHHYVHKHKEIEILTGIDGCGEVICDLETIPMKPGEIVVINPNRVHFIVSDEIFRYYCLIVDSEFLAANGIDTDSVCFEDHIVDEKLLSLIRNLCDEWEKEDEYRNMLLKAQIIEIIVDLCREHTVDEAVSKKTGKTLQKIKHSISYIKNNYRNPLTLEEVAAEAGLSKYHYCREFKKATDLTPVEFINRTRCEYAKTLLESKMYSVSEISEMCGFLTSAHFSKTFRTFFGIYPSEYMKVK